MAPRRNKRPQSLPSSSDESRVGAAAASTISDRRSSTSNKLILFLSFVCNSNFDFFFRQMYVNSNSLKKKGRGPT